MTFSSANSSHEMMTIEAELNVPVAITQLVRFDLPDPADATMRLNDAYWLDLCLTPRPVNARACFRDRWGPHRFERLGDLFLVPPGQFIQVKVDSVCSQTSIVCQLRDEPVRQWLGSSIDWTDRRLIASLNVSSGAIRLLLRRMGEEVLHPGFASPLVVEMIAGRLAVELTRYCEAVPDAPTSGGLASWRLRLIDERLREVREPPTLSELTELCKLSVRQLTRGFRASRGCSIGEYVVQSRIDSAKRLLTRDQSVKSVAHAVGFSSTSSFSYAFRRATGETPGQFRQRAPRLRGLN